MLKIMVKMINGDHVGISKYKYVLRKGYNLNWSEDVSTDRCNVVEKITLKELLQRFMKKE